MTTSFARAIARRAAALLLVVAALGACGGDSNEPEERAGFKALTSEDGALEMQVPNSWEVAELNPVASVQAGDTGAEAYGMVVTDPRGALKDYSLERFAATQMQELVSDLGLASVGGPETVQVDGKDALQYQLKGLLDGVEAAYLYTFVETPDRFLKVVTWSLASRFEENRETLERVSTGVRELKPLPEPTPEPAVSDPAVVPTQQEPGVFDRDPDA